MTRDEFEATLKQARKFGGYGLDPFFDSLLAHDAEQRQVIEQLNSTISKWEDTYAGQKELLEQLRKELELLKADDAERCTLIRDMEEEERKKDAEIDMLREALQLLYDVQNGCPLPTYQKDWDRAMELTQQALKEVL